MGTIQFLLATDGNGATSEEEFNKIIGSELEHLDCFGKVQSPAPKIVQTQLGEHMMIQRFERNDRVTHTEETTIRTYAGMIIPDNVGEVQKIVFITESHDQGPCDNLAGGDSTWFRAAFSGQSADDRSLDKDLCQYKIADVFQRNQVLTWHRNPNDPDIVLCIESTKPGHIIEIEARAMFPTWRNCVRRVEIEICYTKPVTA